MFEQLKLVLHFYIFITWLPDTEQTQGTCCQWKAQSVVSKTSSALTELSASLFHHRPPTSLFSSLALSLGLRSPAVLDSLSALKSSLALLACQAAEGTNGYLRSWAPLPPPTSPSLLLPTSILLLYQNFSISSHCSQLPIPYFSPSTFLLLWSFYHLLLLLSFRFCVAADHPGLFLLLCWLPGNIVLFWSGRGLVRRAGVHLCVCHLVATVPSGRSSWTNTRDLGGPWTAQWKWASHWETWISL